MAPIEERWEAVEQAEKHFQRAERGAATDNISLRRMRDGVELIRVGPAGQVELASWRYAAGLHRRHRIYRVSSGAIGASAALFGFGVAGVAIATGVFFGAVKLRDRRPVMLTSAGQVVYRHEANRLFLVPDDAAAWRVEVRDRPEGDLVLRGPEAIRALRALLPRINWGEWQPDHLRNAVSEFERIGSAERVIRMAAEELEDMSNFDQRYRWNGPRVQPERHRIWASVPVIPLALEMAVTHEAERRALEGELQHLEREWRDAEELAGIADDLLFPGVLAARFRTLRSRASKP